MASSQAAAHVPACSIPAWPGSGETWANLPQVCLWTALEENRSGGVGSGPLLGGVGEAAPTLALSPSWKSTFPLRNEKSTIEG